MYIFTHYVLRLCLRTWNRRVTVDVASILVLMLIIADTSNTLIRDEEEKLVEVLLYVHRNRSLIRDGEPKDGHLDFHTDPELGRGWEGARRLRNPARNANSKHWFTTSFLWRKVPERDARSMHVTQTPSTGLRHPSFGGRCRKEMLGVCT